MSSPVTQEKSVLETINIMDSSSRSKNLLHPLIRERWSPRKFQDRSVGPQQLNSLLEAARWAPSAYNEQPWAFLLATRDDSAEFERMLQCLTPGNQKWAHDAPVLLLTLAKLRLQRNGRENPHAWHDLGLATAQLTLQATALGLAVHPMGGIDAEHIVREYGVPDGWTPVTAIALGYADDAGPASRSRKPLDEFVFVGAWGQAVGDDSTTEPR